MFTDGKNFNDTPLTFQEFIGKNGYNSTTYNNFFFNFCKSRRNFQMLINVDAELAEKLSEVYGRYIIKKESDSEILEGYSYPKLVLEQGYEAYLLLRKHCSLDKDLISRIERYFQLTGGKGNSTDDWAGFFA